VGVLNSKCCVFAVRLCVRVCGLIFSVEGQSGSERAFVSYHTVRGGYKNSFSSSVPSEEGIKTPSLLQTG
jgi:hypothetical protein